ncbi:MAG TPA: SMC-Scp complex subunit ScpB [Alphaproteobacteria bacterium]|jgi:segregation and condensation protein B
MTLAQAEAIRDTPGGDAPPAQFEPIRVLEAMLFASSAPLTMNAIRERLPENADVGGMLLELQEFYKTRGVRLIELEGSWAFRTAAELGDALKVSKEVQRKLSRAAMETLAIVAYHQPLTRAEIENIRGVATNKGTLDVLMECGWVKPGRRRETPGRPLTWVTTTTFMDHFGLESLNELPGLDELKASGILDRRPAIDALPTTGDLFGGEDEQIEADATAGEEKDSDEEFEDDEEDDEDEDYYEDDIDEASLKGEE